METYAQVPDFQFVSDCVRGLLGEAAISLVKS
jgi:hypothetical protein